MPKPLNDANPTTADGYVRVSRVGGREGESFIAPEVQRKKIEDWARLHGVEIVAWWEELDQSGASRDRPMFQEALARCERGETGGIVVARLDRFARSAVDALESIKRMNEVGARLVSVEDNFDGSTPMGRFAIGILTLIAELELERIKESWGTAVREAVRRGVHISARVPTGYRREEDGRLVREEPAASAVAEVFRRRATGASYTELAAFLESEGVLPSTGNRHWSSNGVAGLLRNPVYLGQARSGEVKNDEAHEPLVTQAEFAASQESRSVFRPRDDSVASQALLGGLARCSACGHTLKIAGSGKPGERHPVYYCKRRYASGVCPEPATIRAAYLDEYVEERVLVTLANADSVLARAVEASERIDAAARAVTDAEHELALYLATDLISVVGTHAFSEGVAARQQGVDQARDELAQLQAQGVVAADLTSGDLLEVWPELTTGEKRTLMHGMLERVVLGRAPGRGPGQIPIGDRTQIVLRGNVVLGASPDDSL
jgi:site-specific DNA recombinase